VMVAKLAEPELFLLAVRLMLIGLTATLESLVVGDLGPDAGLTVSSFPWLTSKANSVVAGLVG
jgi:hypothetical protein